MSAEDTLIVVAAAYEDVADAEADSSAEPVNRAVAAWDARASLTTSDLSRPSRVIAGARRVVVHGNVAESRPGAQRVPDTGAVVHARSFGYAASYGAFTRGHPP